MIVAPMDYDLYYSGLTFYFMYMIEYPWDGPTSWIFAVIIFLISPFCGVAQTPDCGIIVPHFPLEESFRHSLGTQYFTLNYF